LRELQILDQFIEQRHAGFAGQYAAKFEAFRRLAASQQFEPLADLAQHRGQRKPARVAGDAKIVVQRLVPRQIESNAAGARVTVRLDQDLGLLAPACKPADDGRKLGARQRIGARQMQQDGHHVLAAGRRLAGFPQLRVFNQFALDAEPFGRWQYGVQAEPELAVEFGAGQVAVQLFHTQAGQCAVRDFAVLSEQGGVAVKAGAQAMQVGDAAGAPELACRFEHGLICRRQRQRFVFVAALAFAADRKEGLAQHFKRLETLSWRNAIVVEGLDLRQAVAVAASENSAWLLFCVAGKEKQVIDDSSQTLKPPGLGGFPCRQKRSHTRSALLPYLLISSDLHTAQAARRAWLSGAGTRCSGLRRPCAATCRSVARLFLRARSGSLAGR